MGKNNTNKKMKSLKKCLKAGNRLQSTTCKPWQAKCSKLAHLYIFDSYTGCSRIIPMLTLGKVPFLQLPEAEDLLAKFLQSCRRIQTRTSDGTHPRKSVSFHVRDQYT